MGRKIYVDLSDTFDAQREKINVLSTNVGDLDNLIVPSDHDSDIVEAINWVYNNAAGKANSSLKIINSSGVIVKELFGFDSA